MKDWPEEGMVDIEDLLSPLQDLIRRNVDWKMKEDNSVIGEYDGYKTGSAAATFDPVWNLSKEGLEYNEERGRDFFDVVMTVAFQLGFEQGKRSEAPDSEIFKRMNEMLQEIVKSKKGKL